MAFEQSTGAAEATAAQLQDAVGLETTISIPGAFELRTRAPAAPGTPPSAAAAHDDSTEWEEYRREGGGAPKERSTADPRR